jgi:transposase
MTFWNFYFQLFEKAVGKEEVIVFLSYLLRHISSPLLIVWDRLPAHKSRLVGEFLDCLNGLIATEYLPPYAPELNPVEYLWGHWKQHELPNVCPKDLWQLSAGARRTLRRLRRRPRLISAFWKQSSLAFN